MVQLVFGIALGFFLPGYIASLLLRSPDRLVSSFILSSVILFHSIFWLGVSWIPITFQSVSVGLVLALALLAVLLLVGKQGVIRGEQAFSFSVPYPERLILYFVFLLASVLFLRATMQPLSGWDTPWRWNFLASRLLELGHFNFYPPVEAEDFAAYFFVDGIPPMVSFSYYWLYASLGQEIPEATGFLVLLQFVLLNVLCFKVARRLSSWRAGVFSIAILGSSPLFFWAVLMGQEVGLTAISLLATLYFLLTSEEEAKYRAAVLAGCAVAFGALSREYGGIFILCGVVACLWQRKDPKAIGVFVLTAAVLSAPWYLRTWVLTGNPFYSHSIGDLFPANPIHAGILRNYENWFGFARDPLGRLFDTVMFSLSLAPLPALLGLVAGILFFKRFGYLAVGGGLLVLVWVYSVGQTAGGLLYSMRVLNPVVLLLSILAGILLDVVVRQGISGSPAKPVSSWIAEERHRAKLVVALLVILCIRATAQNLVVPLDIWEVPPALWLKPSFWISKAFTPADGWPGSAFKEYESLRMVLAKERVLSNVPYLHAELYSTGSSVVPVWSPEVRFLFDRKTTAKTACKTLQKLGIRYIYRETSPYSFTINSYLDRSPFFVQYPSSYVPLLELKGRGILYKLRECESLSGE